MNWFDVINVGFEIFIDIFCYDWIGLLCDIIIVFVNENVLLLGVNSLSDKYR